MSLIDYESIKKQIVSTGTYFYKDFSCNGFERYYYEEALDRLK